MSIAFVIHLFMIFIHSMVETQTNLFKNVGPSSYGENEDRQKNHIQLRDGLLAIKLLSDSTIMNIMRMKTYIYIYKKTICQKLNNYFLDNIIINTYELCPCSRQPKHARARQLEFVLELLPSWNSPVRKNELSLKFPVLSPDDVLHCFEARNLNKKNCNELFRKFIANFDSIQIKGIDQNLINNSSTSNVWSIRHTSS